MCLRKLSAYWIAILKYFSVSSQALMSRFVKIVNFIGDSCSRAAAFPALVF